VAAVGSSSKLICLMEPWFIMGSASSSGGELVPKMKNYYYSRLKQFQKNFKKKFQKKIPKKIPVPKNCLKMKIIVQNIFPKIKIIVTES
jgi:hypothetical protein